MNYEVQFAKVTISGKLPDRFLSSFHSRPPDIRKSQMGETFSLVEILSPWYNSAQIGQMIINDFAGSYYEGGSTSDLENFEMAIKKINENLAEATQNGETEWIGNLNGTLATIVGESMIISPAGKNEVFLFRDGKINHLTEGLAAKAEIHPLKTFSNVISGTIKSHDKILITNKSLLDNLNLEMLAQFITVNDPESAAAQIAKILKKSKIKDANFLIINLLSKAELENNALKDNLESVIYLDKSGDSFLKNFSKVWQVFKPVGRNIQDKTATTLKSTADFIRSRNAARAKKYGIENPPKPEAAPEPQDGDKFQQEFLKSSRDDQLLKDEEIKYSPDLYVHYYQEKKAKTSQHQNNLLRGILQKIFSLLKGFYLFLITSYRQKEKRKNLYILGAVILILVIALVIGFRGHGGGKVGNLDSQKILDEALAAQKDGKNALSLGNTEKAKADFMTAIEKATKIKTNTLVKNDAESVIQSSYGDLDKLTSTTRFSTLSPIVTLPDSGKGLFIVSGEAVMVTETDIYKASLLGGKPQKVGSLPKNKGNFVCGSSLGSILYLYTSNQNLFEFNPANNNLDQTQISADGHWETANALAGYVGSLYLLDGVAGQIYRHSSNDKTFTSGDQYISNNANLKQSLSLAIDGSVYVLKNNGTVVKYQRSKPQDFSLKSVPTPQEKIAGPRKIYTDSDTPSLYLLDTEAKRILEFDKEGVFIRQYAFPSNFTNISDFSVSIKSKKIWILNDKEVYEITI